MAIKKEGTTIPFSASLLLLPRNTFIVDTTTTKNGCLSAVFAWHSIYINISHNKALKIPLRARERERTTQNKSLFI